MNADKKCSVEGCDREILARGFCSMHYRRFRRDGGGTIYKSTKTGVTWINDNGYVLRWIDGTIKREHVIIAEKTIGRHLKKGECVHHVDGVRSNNVPSNLVICPNQAYHSLLHRRTTALNETGDASKRKCTICKKWDDVSSLVITGSNGNTSFHKECRIEKDAKRDPLVQREYSARWYAKQKADDNDALLKSKREINKKSRDKRKAEDPDALSAKEHNYYIKSKAKKSAALQINQDLGENNV